MSILSGGRISWVVESGFLWAEINLAVTNSNSLVGVQASNYLNVLGLGSNCPKKQAAVNFFFLCLTVFGILRSARNPKICALLQLGLCSCVCVMLFWPVDPDLIAERYLGIYMVGSTWVHYLLILTTNLIHNHSLITFSWLNLCRHYMEFALSPWICALSWGYAQFLKKIVAQSMLYHRETLLHASG